MCRLVSPTSRPIASGALLLILVALTSLSVQTQGPPATLSHDRWMGVLFDERPSAMDQSLARFIFPGSHDAGTFLLTSDAACEGCSGSELFSDPVATCQDKLPSGLDGICSSIGDFIATFGQAWGQAQHLSIGAQLNAGARVIDLRVFRATSDDATRSGDRLQDGRFYVHHSLAGPEMTPILNDIQSFLTTAGHENEVIILDFSHMNEGDDDMTADSLEAFFGELRSRFGTYMAPKQDPACAGDPTCAATARFGHATTIRDFLAQGSRVIVTCDCTIDATDIWDSIDSVSPYYVEDLDPAGSEGYPAPDDDDYPWISDRQIFRMLDLLSAERDSRPQDEMFSMGIQLGLDEDALALIRSIACQIPGSDWTSYCPALNDDWDQFQSLADVARYTNPKAIAALVRLRRDRVNIVTADHYDTSFTEEVYKLNRGATRMELVVNAVVAIGSFDPAGNDADFYPRFFYPGVSPRAWDPRVERNIHIRDDDAIAPNWPGWKAYPNDWGNANVGFGITDADSDDDDPASVDGGLFIKNTVVPITECVRNSTSCPSLANLLQTSGTTEDNVTAFYSVGACVWSWLPGDDVDGGSLCGEPLPQLSVTDVTQPEGNSGRTDFDFVVSLSAPSLETVMVRYDVKPGGGGTASGDDFNEEGPVALTFVPGETRKTKTVQVNGDTDIEGDETFFFELQALTGATLEDGRGIGTILNDDVLTLSINDVAHAEGTGVTTPFTFTVTLSAPTSKTVKVRYQTSDDTATAGSDYTELPETEVTFASGETSKTVIVQIDGDSIAEGDETFFVNLSKPDGAVVGDATGIGTIWNDDVPASLMAPPPQSGNEGASIVFNLGTLHDDNLFGPWRITVDWGDGQSESYPVGLTGALSRSHSYADNGAYTVRVSATGGDGVAAANEITFAATIANVNPTASLGNSGPVNEGNTATIGFNSPFDPSSADTTAGLHYAFSCANASLSSAVYATSGTSPSTSCLFDDNAGVHSVRARIIDKDGGFSEYTTTVVVNNVAPTATLSNNGPINEGGSVTIHFSDPLDPSSADTSAGFHYAFSCTNASLVSATYAGSAASATTSCAFADNGAFTVRAWIIDKDDGFTEYSTVVTVNNVPPVTTAAGSVIDETGVATVSGSIVDLGVLDTFTLTVAWGDGASTQHSIAAGATSYLVTHQYLDDNPTDTPSDVVAVAVAIVDKDGGSGGGAAVVTVNNVPPVVGPIALEDETGAIVGGIIMALSGLPIDLEAAMSDVGTLDAHQAVINWGDGVSNPGTIANGAVRASHVWNSLGSYTVTVTVTDDDRGVGTREASVNVVDATGLVCGLGSLVRPLLTAPGLDALTLRALTQLLGEIQGNIDGQAFNGACDMFAKDNLVAALVKLAQAVDTIENLIAAGELSAEQHTTLRLVETHLVLTAKARYLELARAATNGRRLADAAALAQLAEAAAAERDNRLAIGHWVAAVRLLAPSATR